MSHERDLMNYDRRSADEIAKDKERRLVEQAKNELVVEGKIVGHFVTTRQFRNEEDVIRERTTLLRVKSNLEEAQSEYDRLNRR